MRCQTPAQTKGARRRRLRGLTSKDRQEDLLALNGLIEAGKVEPVIDRTYPLSEAPEAIRYLAEGTPEGRSSSPCEATSSSSAGGRSQA